MLEDLKATLRQINRDEELQELIATALVKQRDALVRAGFPFEAATEYVLRHGIGMTKS